MELEKRKEEILKKIVKEYISTGQPVGSERIVEKFHFPISSATARNDMSELEKSGYIRQPYTSAGRVPTSKGYRFFVESILKEKRPIKIKEIKLPDAEKIRDLNEILTDVSELISAHTREISLVFSPNINENKIKYVHFFTTKSSTVYVVLVTSTHTSEAVPIGSFNIEDVELKKIENLINKELSNITSVKALEKISKKNFFDKELKDETEIVKSLHFYLKNELEKGEKREIYIRGISNLLSARISIAEQKVKSLLYILEEKKAISDIVEKITSKDRIGFSIGKENKIPELWDYSLIAVKYTVKEMEGRLALLGPTRMDYLKGIFVLDAIAEKLEEFSDKIIE
jgi:heat-inducible transcriptional repressor